MSILCATGCSHDEPIFTRTVPVIRHRLLGAFIGNGDTVWLFKLSGPIADMKSAADSFATFIKTVHFKSGSTPGWELPKGWEVLPGTAVRFATLKLGKDSALEMAVEAVPIKETLDSINEWRGEFDLYPLMSHELFADATRLTLASGPIATLIDYIGTPAPVRPAEAIPPEQPLPFEYETPEQWKKAPNGIMAKLTFVVQTGPQTKVEITVTPSGGELLANINRWRGQVGLPPVTAEEASKIVKPLQADGVNQQYLKLVGAKETILGVIFERDGWFFKLRGDKELAERERERFEAFVRSVKFR